MWSLIIMITRPNASCFVREISGFRTRVQAEDAKKEVLKSYNLESMSLSVSIVCKGKEE